MTPLQIQVIFHTLRKREEEKKEAMEQDGGGNQPTPTGTPKNAAYGSSSAESRKQKVMEARAERAYGGAEKKRHVSQEYQGEDTPSLIVGEDE